MFICASNIPSSKDLRFPLFPRETYRPKLSCSHCVSGISICTWRVEFKAAETLLWVLLDMYEVVHDNILKSKPVRNVTTSFHPICGGAIAKNTIQYRESIANYSFLLCTTNLKQRHFKTVQCKHTNFEVSAKKSLKVLRQMRWKLVEEFNKKFEEIYKKFENLTRNKKNLKRNSSIIGRIPWKLLEEFDNRFTKIDKKNFRCSWAISWAEVLDDFLNDRKVFGQMF